jgi:hypothetical protein
VTLEGAAGDGAAGATAAASEIEPEAGGKFPQNAAAIDNEAPG